jgi:predicted metalloprotease with PDZ domain
MKSKILRLAIAYCLVQCLLVNSQLFAQTSKSGISYQVSIADPSTQQFQVDATFLNFQQDQLLLHMPAWTTGYYQFMKFADYVSGFTAANEKGESLIWEKADTNSWRIKTGNAKTITIHYFVKGTRPFVATNFMDTDRAYISPAGMCMYPDGQIKHPLTIRIVPYQGWNTVATGLEELPGQTHTYQAADFDILYDSPILMGNLESFPAFTVKGIPHQFIAYHAGSFDRNQFMRDMQKIVTTASGIIGDIPYKHYTFLAIGPGGGGIEHLNSASVAFNGTGLEKKEVKIRLYNFLAHEYFHHYNVKRIRPIELGPFDYENGSRTKMLWLSEGITVYYEYLILQRAGFTNRDDVFKGFATSIKEYENKPGRYYQTPAEASFTTWEDGPFGRTGDEVNKTISPYDKGPALGIILDFKIRHETGNAKSMDDLMRVLYHKYYQQLGRGFTETEFRKEAEAIAGCSLQDFFDYIYTLKTVDYPTYFNYAGLSIDTSTHEIPGAWLGLHIRMRNDTAWTSNIDYQSPAWQAGIRGRMAVLRINGKPCTEKSLAEIMAATQTGETVSVSYLTRTGEQTATLIAGTRKEKLCTITPVDHPDALQEKILKSWLGEK